MHLDAPRKRTPYLDPVTVPTRRDPISGRFLPQSQAWRKKHGLGFDPFSAVAAGFGLPTGAAPGSGGMPGMPGGGGSSTTVSPNIQTSVTPTVSPTFTQIQDSAGARTGSYTSASAPTEQGASSRGGDIPQPGAMTGGGMPSSGGFSTPSGFTPTIRTDYREPANPATSVFADEGGFPWTPLLIGAGILGALAIGARAFRAPARAG